MERLLASLVLEPIGTDRYRAPNAEDGNVVFGGQLLAQSIVAALDGTEGKRVKTVHSVFARAGSPASPVDIAVERIHAGRAFGSTTVTFSQGDRIVTRSQVLLSADEPDFIRHSDSAPEKLQPPDGSAVTGNGPWQVVIEEGVDISDPEQVGPPELDVWTRWDGAPDDPVLDQALLAYATDPFLIGTAMRPHAGVGQSQAHVTLSTGVITHTMTFHEPAPASEWHLLSHHSSYAGGGRCYGSANVYRTDGTLVASYVQDAMIRPLATGSKL